MPTGYCKATGQNPFKGKKRPPISEETREKMSKAATGRSPFNKGKKGYRTHSEETKIKMRESHAKGKEHWYWKGNDVKYVSIHSWVHRNFGKAKDFECSKCGSTENLQWANLDKKYSRDRDTWTVLCCKCHYHFDKKGTPDNTSSKYGVFEYNGKKLTLFGWAKELGISSWTIYFRIFKKKMTFIEAITKPVRNGKQK